MSKATVRANARTLPETTKSMPAAPASPGSAADEYLRLQAAKIVADSLLEVATEKKKAEAAAKAAAEADAEEEPKRHASQEFAAAFHAWLAAKAGIKDPSIEEDEEVTKRYRAESAAERRLMTAPAAWPDQVWEKLSAFEIILTEEMVDGERRDSIILLSLASIKQDIHNLGLCNGGAS
jgi:dienelactone hydrolase